MSETVSVERTIAAPPERVWEMISDVTRMGEWSPETTRGTWIGGADGPAVGARFRGQNRKGMRRWSTVAEVKGCTRGREFRFLVTAGPFPVAEWTYWIEAVGEGCTVTETWDDRRSWLARVGGVVISGVSDRAAHNRAGMEETLQRLATAAEGAAA
ncbi:MAG: SRPBCC family protein [Acidimicrobiia bacterium]|nr:SRPBCC family protein [Acidimicrobiia bacterium]